MNHDFYSDPHLYDALFPASSGPGTRNGFYLEQAIHYGKSVLELGCGTGEVLLPIASRGQRCVGLDLSPAMLESARLKARKSNLDVVLIEGDMRGFELDERFDLVLVANNSLLHLHATADLVNCLRSIVQHLNSGGRLIFDVFNPDVALLAEADGARRERERLLDPDRGEIRVDVAASYDAAAQVTREVWYFSAGDEPDFLVAPLEIRSIFPRELPLLAEAGGLRLLDRFGDFNGGVFSSSSRHQVCICLVK